MLEDGCCVLLLPSLHINVRSTLSWKGKWALEDCKRSRIKDSRVSVDLTCRSPPNPGNVEQKVHVHLEPSLDEVMCHPIVSIGAVPVVWNQVIWMQRLTF
jgi:hypothetical protein